MWLNAKHLYFMLSGVIVIAVLALGACVYLATGFLKEKSKDVRDARLLTMVLERRQSGLRKAKNDIEKYKHLAEIAKSIVPQDKDQAQTVREISNLAAANNVKLGSISFPSSSLGAAKSTSDAQLKSVKSIPGTFVLNITVRSDSKTPAAYTNFLSFLKALEQNRRTALVTGISLTPDQKTPSKIQFSLTIDEYIKP